MSPLQCDKLEIAGLLHDLGKLQVPDEILEKKGPLTVEERQQIQRHSFETYQILRRIDGLEDLAIWAAYHHQALDGSGYPFRLAPGQLSTEARIVAVADVFQALAQRRPYREPLEPQAILAHLQQRAADGVLDTDIVGLVAGHLEDSWLAAIGEVSDAGPLAAGAAALSG